MIKQWIVNNLRFILPVVIVVVISTGFLVYKVLNPCNECEQQVMQKYLDRR